MFGNLRLAFARHRNFLIIFLIVVFLPSIILAVFGRRRSGILADGGFPASGQAPQLIPSIGANLARIVHQNAGLGLT
jgi:hypothetical protein